MVIVVEFFEYVVFIKFVKYILKSVGFGLVKISVVVVV